MSVLNEAQVKRILRGLSAELAYLALVETSIVPPHSLLRSRLSRIITPEFISFLAMRIGGSLEVYLNSMLGARLGGMPKCEILAESLPELYQLCKMVKYKGDWPLYKAVNVLVPLAISASAAGLEEGDILLASYNSAARGGDSERVLRYFSRWYVVAKF